MSQPIIITKFSNENLKVLELKGNKNDKLSDHKVSMPAILCCIEGRVVYNQSGTKHVIEQDEFKLIPSDMIHNVEFSTESTIDLILFAEAKLRFTTS